MEDQMTSMNISLPESLRDFAEGRAAKGYSSVSEYIRALLRDDRQRAAREKLDELLLKGLDTGPGDEITPELFDKLKEKLVEKAQAAAHSTAPDLDDAGIDWRELRVKLLAGEFALFEERANEIAELFGASLELARARIAAENPGASEEVLQKHLAQWLRERAGADFGDGPGTPISSERIESILSG